MPGFIEISLVRNLAPVVDGGADQTVDLEDRVSLDGTVTDDGLPDPPRQVITNWSQVSGPGMVTFGNAGAVDTTATFSQKGEYVLRLSAEDGQLQGSDEMTVRVQAPGGCDCHTSGEPDVQGDVGGMLLVAFWLLRRVRGRT